MLPTASLIVKIKAIINCAMFVLAFQGMHLGFLLMIFGSKYIRIILILLYIWQFFITKKSVWLEKVNLWLDGENYFNKYTITFEEDFDLEKDPKTIIPFIPHGIMGFSRALLFNRCNKKFTTCSFLASRGMLIMPWAGIMGRLMGFRGVNPESFKQFMREEKPILFVPGGFEEATLCNYDKDRIFQSTRKGWIKYALQFGYKVFFKKNTVNKKNQFAVIVKVIPNYGFNENKAFKTWTNLKVGFFLNKLKIPGVLFWSKYVFFPYHDIDLHYVFGKSIQFPTIANPTKEEINKYHEMFLKAELDLFDKYKTKFGLKTNLEIF